MLDERIAPPSCAYTRVLAERAAGGSFLHEPDDIGVFTQNTVSYVDLVNATILYYVKPY